MKDRLLSRKMVVVCVLLIASPAISLGVLSSRRQRISQKQKQVVALPPVVSHVPKLRISNIHVKNAGTTDAIAVIEILNTSSLAVMSVEISTKNEAGDSGAVNEDGLLDPNNPHVVIPPFGTKTLEMSFSEMVPDAPLVVSAAVFADGTEEGDKWSRDALRGMRLRHQESRAVKDKPKGGPQR